MGVRIKLPPCFSSSKWSKLELIEEAVLSRGPLWQNVHYMECRASGDVVMGKNGQPLCQELEISLCSPGGKVSYTPTGAGHAAPLTLAVCCPGWDGYQDLGETVAEMSQCLIDEDGQLEGATPRGGSLQKQKDTAQIMVLPPNDDTMFVPTSEFPGSQYGLGTRDNPVNLSDAPTKASHTATRPESMEPIDEAAMLGHFSDALSEMAASLLDFEDSYFKALREVIIKTERALQDVSRIDAHYMSQVVTVMASWQEVVQTAVTHMENVDLTIYLVCQEDAQRAMQEYVAAVVKAREERDAAHATEAEARKQAIKSGDPDHFPPLLDHFPLRRKTTMIQSAQGCIDSSRVLSRPLVMGAAALVTPQHSHPLLFCTEGISSCHLTEKGCPAVHSVHHHREVRALDSDHWTKT